MQNIYKVIGIIKGISFDGIINKKEIELLHIWLTDNRHFSTTSNQQKLIKLIEKALDDRILTDFERRNILSTAEVLLKLENNENSIYNELNGIIEGIISDDVVNKEEIVNLEKWCNLYSSLINGNENYVIIKNVLNKVLEDNVITSEEQNLLLILLKNKIKELNVNTKIDYLKKQIKEKNNIGIELISIIDKSDNVEVIHTLAESEIRYALNSYSGTLVRDTNIVIISLSLIAMLGYDGNFYDSVKATYKSLYQQFSEQKIEGLIRNILDKYRTKEDKNTRTRIINIPLRHAIVPKYFLANFFEFIYDIYKINFQCELTDALYEDFQFVYEGLKSNMLTEGDTLEVNVTQKSYKLIQTTKDLVTKGINFDPIIKLSIIIVQLIDKQIWNEEVVISNNYLKEGFDKWSGTLKERDNSRNERKDSTWRSSWQTKFYLEKTSILLLTPIHKIKSQYNYEDIKIVIKNGDKIIYENSSPDIREIIGGYQISFSQIKIDQPLGYLRYYLMSKNDVIYDSKEQLYREFIVFDENGNELLNDVDYKGTALFCTKNKQLKTDVLYEENEYILAYAQVQYGDVFLIEDTIFNFSSLTRPGIYGEKFENHFIVKTDTDVNTTIYSVYKKIKYLVFEDKKTDCTYEVSINNKPYKLKDFNTTITSREGVNKYVIDLNIIKANIYKISVNKIQGGKKYNIETFNIAYDPKLTTEFVKIDDKSYIVSINTELTTDIIIEDINLDNFDIDDIQFEFNNEKYVYRIPFELEIYRISNDIWKPITEDLWIDDIKYNPMIDIYGLDIDGIMVCSPKGDILEEFIPIKDKGVYKQVSIEFLFSYKNSYEYIKIYFLRNQKSINVLRCNNKCIIEDDGVEISFDSVTSDLFITTQFKGKSLIFYEILDKNNNIVIKSDLKKNNETFSFQGLSSFEKYIINIYEKNIGLKLSKGNLLKELHRTFYARKDFVGKSFKINEVYYYKTINKKLVEEVDYFNKYKYYIEFTKQIDNSNFIGKIYSKTHKGIYWLNNINPVEIEINSDVISETMDLYITNQGDGLLIDLEYNRIINKLEEFNSPCIEIYIVNVN